MKGLDPSSRPQIVEAIITNDEMTLRYNFLGSVGRISKISWQNQNNAECFYF